MPIKLMVNGKRVFQRKGKNHKRNVNKILVLDIETWGLDATAKSFALGVIYDGNSYIRFTDIKDMQEYIISADFSGYSVFGHNAGNYDYYCLFGNLFDYFGAENVIINGSTFIMAKYKIREREKINGKKSNEYIYFFDSLNILKSSVKDLGKSLGLNKLDTPDKFKSGLRSAITETDFIYCERDCKIVFDMLQKVSETTGTLKPTIASIAMDCFQRNYQIQDYFVDEFLDLQFRNAYYGGRVECYKLGKLDQTEYGDINSLYPYVMLDNPYPNPGNLIQLCDISEIQFLNILNHYEGCCELELIHHKSEIGFLPMRLNNKLCFPIGKLTGWWNFPEIRFALKHNMIDIIKIKNVIYAPKINSPFKDYVEKFWNLKNNSTGAEKLIYKYLLNSLYGKFGEYRDFENIYAKEYDPFYFAKLLAKYKNCNIDIVPISENRSDIYYKISNNDQLEAMRNHTIFCWASYVTSYSRIRNLELQLLIRETSNIYYTDTDSFVCDKIPLELISKELGMLKIEDIQVTEIYGNKWYLCKHDNKLIQKIKGVNKDYVQTGNKFEYNSIMKLKSGIRQNQEIGKGIKITKELKSTYDKRSVGLHGLTFPLVFV